MSPCGRQVAPEAWARDREGWEIAAAGSEVGLRLLPLLEGLWCMLCIVVVQSIDGAWSQCGHAVPHQFLSVAVLGARLSQMLLEVL